MKEPKNTKIFKVEDVATGHVRLIDAATASEALRHAVKVSAASARDVADAMAKGVVVEVTGEAGSGQGESNE